VRAALGVRHAPLQGVVERRGPTDATSRSAVVYGAENRRRAFMVASLEVARRSAVAEVVAWFWIAGRVRPGPREVVA
jgi:hypothetical protein